MHLNSRPWKLAHLKPGESLILEVPPGRSLSAFMSQCVVDFGRIEGMKFSQALVLGVDPKTRTVSDLVRITRVT